MYDELGIGEMLDELIVQDFENRKISIGQAVKAMVLNGLGFTNQRLYLVPHFFANKPTERLIGEGVTPDQLNDDVLGRALDALFEHGVTALYSQVAQSAAERLGLDVEYSHLDGSSFHVDGRYNSSEEPEPGVIHITQGYSRDHRPDLNQVVLNLICDQQAGIPLLMAVLSGNTDDKSSFRRIVRDHLSQLQVDYAPSYFVADSALYNKQSLQALEERMMLWISRVPATNNVVKELLEQANPADMLPIDQNHRYLEVGTTYGDVKQRWLVIHSAAAQQRSYKTLSKQSLKKTKSELKGWNRLTRQEFACEEDANLALELFNRSLTVTNVVQSAVVEVPHYSQRGRPAANAVAQSIGYRIEGALASDRLKFERTLTQKSLFVLATNQLDSSHLSPQALLDGYKGQQSVERGFRFLKDPLFLASSLFLKLPRRIMALMMVMTLCLLVYAALQFKIRKSLQAEHQFFPDQKGKPTQFPTARWVFHYFIGIHLLRLPSGEQLVINLKETHRSLLGLLGPPYLALYS